MTRFRLSTFMVVSVLGGLLLTHLPAAAKESWSWAQTTAQSTIEPWTSFETQESLASTADIDWNQTPDYLHYMREEDGVFPKDTGPRDFSGVWRGQPPRQGLEDMRRGRPDETPASAQLKPGSSRRPLFAEQHPVRQTGFQRTRCDPRSAAGRGNRSNPTWCRVISRSCRFLWAEIGLHSIRSHPAAE